MKAGGSDLVGELLVQRLVAAQSEDDGSHSRMISGYTVVLRAVTRNGADIGKFKEMLTTDHLTGACNRAYFLKVSERQRLRCSLQGQPLALDAMDIDQFKQVNDSHGHATGNTVLKAVATTCKAVLRANDTFARLGGEEFVVSLSSTDMTTAVGLAERLQTATGAVSVPASGKLLSITASFGCSATLDSSMTLTELLAVADPLLNAAKRKGRNRVEPDTRASGDKSDSKGGCFAAAAESQSKKPAMRISG